MVILNATLMMLNIILMLSLSKIARVSTKTDTLITAITLVGALCSIFFFPVGIITAIIVIILALKG